VGALRVEKWFDGEFKDERLFGLLAREHENAKNHS
jgi:hypothetical protein